MLDQSQMKVHDEAQMEAPVRRLSQSSVGSSVQSLIQCLMREEEEASFFIVVFIHLLFIFLFISICCESLPDVAYMPETYTDAYANARCLRECQTPTRMPHECQRLH